MRIINIFVDVLMIIFNILWVFSMIIIYIPRRS